MSSALMHVPLDTRINYLVRRVMLSMPAQHLHRHIVEEAFLGSSESLLVIGNHRARVYSLMTNSLLIEYTSVQQPH